MIMTMMMPIITHLFFRWRKYDFFMSCIISTSEDLWKLAYIRSERRRLSTIVPLGRYMSEANITYKTSVAYFCFILFPHDFGKRKNPHGEVRGVKYYRIGLGSRSDNSLMIQLYT